MPVVRSRLFPDRPTIDILGTVYPRRPLRKILLVFPPTRISRESLKFCQMPLGISYLAAYLRPRFTVEILDATAEGYDHEEEDAGGFFRYGLPRSALADRIRRSAPDVVGISCLFSPNYPAVEDTAEIAKQVNPEILTVVGGNHPTWLANECLARPKGRHIDFIVMGEGEEKFKRLLEALDSGAAPGGEEIRQIDGLAYRGLDDNVVVQPMISQIPHLDAIPFPARDLLPMDRYESINLPHIVFSKHRRHTSLFTGRGCPAHCTFCSSTFFWGGGGNLRNRSPANVLDEIGECIAKWNIREFHIEDDNFTADPEHAKAICRGIIERGYEIRWSAPNGIAIWTLDEELVRLMKESGVRELVLAFESGSQEVLNKVIHKPLRLKNAIDKVALIRKYDIRHNAFFMIGLPGETRNQIEETLRFMQKLRLEAANLFAFFPLPGTPAFETCVEKGWLKRDYDFTMNSSTQGRLTTDQFTAGEITAWVRRNWTLNYLRTLGRHPLVFLQRYGHLALQPRSLAEITRRLRRRLIRGA